MDLEEQKQKESIVPYLEALMNFFFFKFLVTPLGGGIKPTLPEIGRWSCNHWIPGEVSLNEIINRAVSITNLLGKVTSSLLYLISLSQKLKDVTHELCHI